tara:strand:+ start:271 stop:396 length:126 start_codon:yes stop_codon:yes gene_type:complete
MTEIWVALGLLLMVQSVDIIDWVCDKITAGFNKEKKDEQVK